MAQSEDVVVDIEGRHLKLSNLDKVLYPEAGFTKGQVIDYFVRIAPARATMNDHSSFLCSLLVAMVVSTSLLNFQFARSQALSCSCNRFSRDWQLLVRSLSQSTPSN